MGISNSSNIRLVEPSNGKIITLKVIANNPILFEIFMKQLKTYANNLTQIGVNYKINVDTVTLVFPNADLAEATRQVWK